MKQIYVALERAGKSVPVGVIRFDDKQKFGYFTYLQTYDGPPLDPVNLNYRAPVDPKDRFRRGERVFVVDANLNPGLMHQVFVDAMPGQWGMAVLQAEYPEIRQMGDAERLHWMGARTSGALSFFVQTQAKERVVHGLDELEVVRAKCAEFLAKLQKMGLEGIRNPAVASHGGVMPKAAYEDSSGRHWIAKFDRPGEGTQYSVLEHLACRLAARCGITTPETRAIPDGMGGHMFLTERFDRTAEQRHHKASFMSLSKARDAAAGDYRDIFKTLKSICGPAVWPAQRDEMLRRMAFGVGLNITDDHLRNHEARLTPAGSWELSPAFDLVPVSGPSPHQCALFGRPRADINMDKAGTRAFWAGVAEELGATPEHVIGLVEKVSDTIKAEWPALVKTGGLNRFNQMNALMAAEVGCAATFPEEPSVGARVIPLSAKTRQALASARQDIDRALRAVRGESKLSGAESLKLSMAMTRLSGDSADLARQLQQAFMSAASEAMLATPWQTAARALLEGTASDGRLVRDLEEVASMLDASLEVSAQLDQVAENEKTPAPPARRAPR